MTHISAGIDVGSGAVKVAVMRTDGDADETVIAKESTRIRRREVAKVVDEVFEAAVSAADMDEIHYIATTGEGRGLPVRDGALLRHDDARAGRAVSRARAGAVLDVGALHTRAVAMDARGRVVDYKMTSQCASGSGQFLENIARYLGVSHDEIGALSMDAKKPEKVSSICAVLAETDVINMVSRGITTQDILRGVHESMADRFVRLLRSLDVRRSGVRQRRTGVGRRAARGASRRAREEGRPRERVPRSRDPPGRDLRRGDRCGAVRRLPVP